MLPPDVIDNPNLHRFELQENGETAFLIYDNKADAIRLVHTEVPSALRGKGVGAKW